MAKILTQDWCDAYMKELNNSKVYEEEAKNWEGDFYFIYEPGGPLKETAYIHIDLWHGKCRSCEMVADPKKFKPAYTLAAPYPIWKQVNLKQLDQTKAMMTRQLKITGDMAIIMRFTKAASEMTSCSMRVKTEWLD
jgi:putative sterol carrier protein